MNLKDYVSRYALAHDLVPSSIEQLGFAVAALDKWLGCPSLVESLSDDLLNRWINARLASGRSRRTIRGQRGAILTLWRAAYDDGLVGVLPKCVKIVKVPEKNPDAYWPDEVARLLVAAESAPGRFKCGARRSHLLRAWLLFSYYTLLRQGDLRRLRRDEVAADGAIVWTQNKTGELVTRQVYQDALDAIAACEDGVDSPLVFPVSKKTIEHWFRWLKRRANVKGCPKWLRRSGATHCERDCPGSAMLALGHKTAGLAYKHYVDRRQTNQRPPTPPRITPPS